ncbi:MAG: DUF4892 domain-containing protein [Steroidobacteraceae bacterium]|nr:DUF4892 domain-containing protein [Steroidobacteraceae bacterium]
MPRSICAVALAFGLFAASGSALAHSLPTHDIPGSHDSPIVSRFAGSVIVGYQSVEFDQLVLPLGGVVRGNLSRVLTVNGAITKIAYIAPSGKSALEVWLNYRQALAAAGFRSRFTCSASEQGPLSGLSSCGDVGELTQILVSEDLRHAMASPYRYRREMIETLDGPSTAYLETAHRSGPSGSVDLMLLIAHSPGRPVGVLLEICKGKAMPTGEVTVAEMNQRLARDGHVALRGIHFATDSAQLTAESASTLARMVAFMNAKPTLKVYIVGNTDDNGTLAHNLALSRARAQAVVEALVARGIPAARMAAEGIASFSPVTSNHTAMGRAKNRRVELVEQ